MYADPPAENPPAVAMERDDLVDEVAVGVENVVRPDVSGSSPPGASTSSQHYSLRWNNHQHHLLGAFEVLLQVSGVRGDSQAIG